MTSREVLEIYREVQADNNPRIYTQKFVRPVFSPYYRNIRKGSIVVNDSAFGDSGKGAVGYGLADSLKGSEGVAVLRYNGGANAGHEVYLEDGRIVITHQLPVAVALEGSYPLMGRGMVSDPLALMGECETIAQTFDGSLPSTPLIDSRTPLSLDYHRAKESADRKYFSGVSGSTASGIGGAFSDFYGRADVTYHDLMSFQWRDVIGERYDYYRNILRGLGIKLEDAPIFFNVSGKRELMPVGPKEEFLKRLSDARDYLTPYVKDDFRDRLMEVWKNPNIPFIFEGAQGAGLDPYHGIRPDITASRPLSRALGDSTYAEIQIDNIDWLTAVTKTTYMSSVGVRELPTLEDDSWKEFASWVQPTFVEEGRTSHRIRDIYPISIPILEYLKKADGYEYLVATHLDAAREDLPVWVITHYTDKDTGGEKLYSPYQDDMDRLVAHAIAFKGWNGREVAEGVKSPKDLPIEVRKLLAFLSRTVAPVVLGKTGPLPSQKISWAPQLLS